MIAVVVVNWNGRPLLDACLASVLTQTPPPELVYLIDNGSNDGSAEHVRSRWPSVLVLSTGTNLGFAGGNNVGIRAALAAGADSILLLNNDAQLLPGALQRLVFALERGPHLWAAAPKIRYRNTPGVIWAAGGNFDWWRGVAVDRGMNEWDVGQYDQPETVESATACCVLIRSKAFREFGLLDESYFMYFEDADFAARLGEAGAGIAYEPAAEVLHDVFGSSGGAPNLPSPLALYYSTRNRAQFIRRHGPTAFRRLAAHTFTLLSRAVRLGQELAHGRPRHAAAIGRGLWDGYVRPAPGRTLEPVTGPPTHLSSSSHQT